MPAVLFNEMDPGRKVTFAIVFSLFAMTMPELHCHCDRCHATNNTCSTNGTCLLTLKRRKNGDVKMLRKCLASTREETQEGICRGTGRYSRVSQCCSENFCNAGNNLSLPTHKPTPAADFKDRGRPLRCKCDKCRSSNGICVTNTRVGACFILLWREDSSNKVKKFRRCATPRRGQSLKQMCRNRDHLHAMRHCCTENMCNIDSDMQVPTWEPVTPQLLTPIPARRLTCYCDSCRETNYTCVTPHACVTNGLRQQNGSIRKRRHCLSYGDVVRQNLECGSNEKVELNYRVRCCYSNLCNTYNLVSFDNMPLEKHPNSLNTAAATTVKGGLQKTDIIIIVSGAVVLVIVGAILWFKLHASNAGAGFSGGRGGVSAVDGETAQAIEMTSISTGSGGRGCAIFQQQTIMKMVEFCEEVGRGRFGQVVRGYYRGEEVAVKIFPSNCESSWYKEVEVFKKATKSHHSNILREIFRNNIGSNNTNSPSHLVLAKLSIKIITKDELVAADQMDAGVTMERHIITEYHANGCLQDFLARVTLSTKEVVIIALSVASGLAHLHCDIVGALGTGKPAIVHRDLKSRNILVKQDGTCCIADFGLAVCRDTPVDYTLVGTKRYLSPEFVDDSYDKTDCFSAYKQRDVYAMGLVLWETSRRCSPSEGIDAFDYQVPFYDKVPSEPSLEDMKTVICDEGFRPQIADSWTENEVLCSVVRVMKGCWSACSHARLTALRCKKTLQSLLPKQC